MSMTILLRLLLPTPIKAKSFAKRAARASYAWQVVAKANLAAIGSCSIRHPPDVPVLMLAVINKGERANLPKAERNALRKELAGYVDDYRASVRQKIEPLRRRRKV
jgi:hypothetical protein